MAADTSVLKVLLTVELAEHILSYLPFQDLVQAELVCRAWRDIIQWSSHTRQGLFLEPTTHHLSVAYRSESKLRKPWQYRSLNIMRYIETYTIAVLHPYLEFDSIRERRGLTAFTFNWEKALSLRPEGRWKTMFITQPPCRNVKVEYQVGVPNALFTGRTRISESKGVQLGLMVDTIRELLAHPGDHGDLQPMPTATPADGREYPQGAWFERLDCYIDGFISETAAFTLASKAAESARKPRPMNLE